MNIYTVLLKFTLSFLFVVASSAAHAVDVSVVDENGSDPGGFKWTLEENLTFDVAPGVQTQDSVSLSFHNSYSPVVDSGYCSSSPCSIPTVAGKRYIVSVLPYAGHTLGASTFSGNDSAVTVDVHTHAVPTTQITVRVFQDNHPINGAPDDPQEAVWPPIKADGNPSNGQFTVHLAEAGGRYGATGGEVTQDAFGNPLGTTYNASGDVISLGNGSLVPDADGYVYIKNIPPAKYGITVIPPPGEGWIQTSTIEGTKTVDAWVMANGPEFFSEFGPPGPHVFIGFVQEFTDPRISGSGSISGVITSNHTARPPEIGFYSGAEFGGCWVGLNESAIDGQGLFAKPCNGDSSFSLTGIPDGDYQLVVWDANLDIIIAFRTVTITGGAAVDLGEVPVFAWFGRTETKVFYDANENGFRDDNELDVLPEQATGFRFRNGTPYIGFPTDNSGEAPYDEVFPFFHWLVAEVDFARYKATGVTYVVDDGGEIPADNGWNMPSLDILTPQPQAQINPNTGNDLSTTLTGPVITLGTQLFAGQTNIIEWGKSNYGTQDVDNAPYGDFPGSGDVDHNSDGVFEYGNGGISGLALYAITRAEDDPRYGAAEEWEPGIPRVQMNLYRDQTGDGVIDDVDGDTQITLADVDNAPQGNFPGPEDVDRNTNGFFDYGDAIQVTYTDSWDDSQPTGCVHKDGQPFIAHEGTAIEKVTDCYDGLRNFNQIREGVYDGGYAFTSRIARDTGAAPTANGTEINPGETPDEIPGLVPGYYIVESAVPDGYVLMKEEDKNVDFGDEFVVPAQLPPVCVGDDHVIPEFLSFQTDESGALLPGVSDPINAPYYVSGEVTTRPLCDRKQVALTGGKNAAADFFMFTQAPVAAHVIGGILNDLANQNDPANPNFGEKFALPWAPVTFTDWEGNLVAKVYADEFGKYEALLPSTYSVNIASPTGLSPNMLNACMNDPSPIPNPLYPGDPTASPLINDPYYNPQFSTFCYIFQFMPGSTTYLDTPVVPIAAFGSTGEFPVDCEAPDNYPLIKSVTGTAGMAGPVLPIGQVSRELSILSEGIVDVPNHLFGAPGEPLLVTRNHGFGATQGAGKVFIGGVELTPGDIVSWDNDEIVINVPAGTPTGQLIVMTDSGNMSTRSITVTTHLAAADIHEVTTTIQAAIDAADPGDLVLVPPGTYQELIIMDKPVQLQGFGAGVSKISAVKSPTTILANWRSEIAARAVAGSFDYLPNQTPGFLAEEGPGVIVLGKASGNFTQILQPRIDGIQIAGASEGGGIFVNGYVDFLNISNNKITGNAGVYGGGIRVGNPEITVDNAGREVPVDSDNDSINIHDNEVVLNGSLFGPAGGIGMYTGSSDYIINHNFVCGNFAQDNGAGINHLGLSDNGVISNNTIAFNQNFNQGFNVHGAGLFIGGQPGLNQQETEGAGNVLVEANLIQGNSAGAGLGGGVMLSRINGVDVENNPGNSSQWYGVDLFDNIIVNNHAGDTGAGIAIQDAIDVRILNNTIAHNDATATVGSLFDTVANSSAALARDGAGIALFGHASDVLLAEQPVAGPEMQNNILWENRKFYWEVNLAAVPLPTFTTVFDSYSDLGVIGAGVLNSSTSILTGGTTDPGFVLDYFNDDRSQTIVAEGNGTNFGVTAAFDEGGNFVEVQYGPLSITGDYHLRTDSDAIDAGATLAVAQLADDIDGESRDATFDIGADELALPATDTDGDGVIDTLDNCILVVNPDQRDTNSDGYGNACDADLDNDGTVGFSDIIVFLTNYGTTSPDADLDGNGAVDFSDYLILLTSYGSAPGPSGTVD